MPRGNLKNQKINKISCQHATSSLLFSRCWLLDVGVNQEIFILQGRIYKNLQ